MGFVIVAVFIVAENNDAGLGSIWFAVLVCFNNEDTHRGQTFGNKTFTAKREILFLVDSFIDSKRFEPPFLLEVGVKPDVAIRVGRMKGLLE